jgi:hypothetical protein
VEFGTQTRLGSDSRTEDTQFSRFGGKVSLDWGVARDTTDDLPLPAEETTKQHPGRRCQEFCVNGFRLVDGFRLHWLHLGGG